jgi:adenylate kinase
VNLLLFGAPGSGKGTQAAFLSDHLGIPQVSTGALFRKEAEEGTSLGRTVKGFMDRGELVPDDITVQVLRKRLSEADGVGGVLLDGFPRTVAQAQELDRMMDALGRHLDRVISMRVPEEELVRRLSGRLVCPVCGSTYHRDTNPPRNDLLCDRDGTPLIERDDDRPETARRRISVYREQTEPVLDYYRGTGVIREIDGDGPIDGIRRRILEALDGKS